MTPMPISVCFETGPVALWQDPTPNSIFLTRPIQLFKAKESRGFTDRYQNYDDRRKNARYHPRGLWCCLSLL